MRRTILFLLAPLLAACMTHAAPEPETGAATLHGQPAIVIGHRGAPGERPEHTLAGYELAISEGADFIEPDLVMTSDGIPIVRHDHFLSASTDVADHPEFAARKRARTTLEGERTDWWADDFTLAEIKTLRARQAFPGRSTQYDGLYEIPTFAEVVALAARKGVGIYPEIKPPLDPAAPGPDMTGPVLAALSGFDGPVYIQSFVAGILRELDAACDWPLIQLVSGEAQAIAAGWEPPLSEVAAYADGIGPYKQLLWSGAGTPSALVGEAHALGLQVHPWTYRADAVGEGFATVEAEIAATLDMGVDGFFTDFPGIGAKVRDAQSRFQPE